MSERYWAVFCGGLIQYPEYWQGSKSEVAIYTSKRDAQARARQFRESNIKGTVFTVIEVSVRPVRKAVPA